MIPAPGRNPTGGPVRVWLDQPHPNGALRRPRPNRLDYVRLETLDRVQHNSTYPRAVVAEHTADYRTFGQAEELRIGSDHPSRIQSLVGTRPAPADGLFNAAHLLQVEMT